MLRNLLIPLLPPDAPIAATFLSNIRLKVKRILDQRDAQGYYSSCRPAALLGCPEQTRFQDRAPYIDEASSRASELLKEVVAGGLPINAARMLSYLKKLHEVVPGFSFRVSYDLKQSPRAFVWQTPAMRAAYEQFGGVLFLDMMKRQLNDVSWPYCGVVLLDGDKKITLACESIVYSERLESYKFIVEACLDMAPQRTRESLKVVFGDGILSNKLLSDLGINGTCKLVLDWHHLHEDWKNHFGPTVYGLLSETLKALRFSHTVEAYSTNYAKLLALLSGKHEAEKAYVQYEENLGKLGDQGAEANYSSYCRRIAKHSKVEPAKQLQQTLD
jgi:hypothetical protein